MRPPKYRSVMLIDDQSVDNNYNEELIRNEQLAETVFVHTTALAALECLKNMTIMGKAANDLIPSYIFLDVYMPQMDGFSFLNEYDKLPAAVKDKIKVIMLTSSGSSRDAEAAKNHPNISLYIQKPLTPELLRQL